MPHFGVGQMSGNNDAGRSPMEIGRRIKAAREQIGLSQQAMAQKIGSSKTGIQANEAGRSIPGGGVLIELMRLGISANWVLTGAGSMRLSDDVSTSVLEPIVDGERLGLVLSIIEQVIADREISFSAEKRGRLAAVLYRHLPTDKAESDAIAYVSQLIDLIMMG